MAPAAKTPLEKVKQSLKNINASIANLTARVTHDGNQTWRRSTIVKHQKEADSLRTRLEDTIEEAGNACDPTQYDVHLAEVLASSKLIDEIDNFLEVLPGLQDPTPPPPPVAPISVRLPTIELPSFDGNPDNWLHFHDVFEASIHKRTDLTNVQKLQYLNSSLKGKAAKLIKDFTISNENYTDAWTVVTNRYNKKHLLISAQLQRLFTQPAVTIESSESLRDLLDTTTSCVASLKTLGAPLDWDLFLIYICCERVDKESRRMWDMQRDLTALPTFQDFVTFVEKRADSLDASPPVKSKAQQHSSKHSNPGKKTAFAGHTASDSTCNVCDKDHRTYKCEKLLQASLDEKKNLVKQKNLCYNCLHKGHRVSDCKSKFSCQKCKARHNTLLHEERQPESSPVIPKVSNHFTVPKEVKGQVLLATALVRIRNENGDAKYLRALIDPGSEATFISENAVQGLSLPTKKVNVEITGLAATSVGTVRKSCSFYLESCVNSFSSLTEAYVHPGKLTRPLPSSNLTQRSWSHISKLTLADPSYHTSAPIDLLIGADIYADIIRKGQRRGPKGTPTAFQSVFGWLLTGRLPLASHSTSTLSANYSSVDLDQSIERFWELEKVPDANLMTSEERECEEHFHATHTRLPNGAHQVRLPFRKNGLVRGLSRDMALRRFLSGERRLAAQPERKLEYHKFMDEYQKLGHMRKLARNETQETSSYYLPHHDVAQESSTTTKLRVVFDASAKTSTGVSLNNQLMVGPTIQDTIMNHILRFRIHVVALTADVAKMYRQVSVHPKDTPFQRILWRDDPSKPIDEYELLTVTYGTGPAPYLATKCLQHFTPEEEARYPNAAKVIRRDFYVDDLMSGAESTPDAIRLKDDLIQLLKLGGFQLRKWSSNDPAVLESLPEEWRETKVPLSFDTDDCVKTLGLKWNPGADEFSFSVFLPVRQTVATKRTLLSDTARLFDPMGWLAPVTIKAKILFQFLWKENITWDKQLPPAIMKEWTSYLFQLPMIERICIKRCIIPRGSSKLQLHGFADASEVAYAAVVYLRSVNVDGTVNVHMVSSKTKVAPMKTVSIPRLELCAALLLAKLMKTVQKALQLPIEEIHAWSDSTITLCWLSSPPSRWNTFVANRVAKIQEDLPRTAWHHVQGTENPADCASRGILPGELISHPLWWNGPTWLSQPSFAPVTLDEQNFEEALKEERRIVQQFQVNVDFSLLEYFSSLTKLERITAYWLRYFYNLRCKSKDERRSGPLDVNELKSALHSWIRKVQGTSFLDDIHSLQQKKPLSSRSTLRFLDPFLDDSGLLRVGGRLCNAPITPDRRHPIILPQRHHLTELIINHEHLRLLHAGPQLLLASLQRQYWLMNGRNVIRKVVRRCMKCIRLRGSTVNQMMGNLPAVRVTQSRPFLNCGVDFAGPLTLRSMTGRSMNTFKAYISVFVCFSTRAIHLELVGALTTDAFMGALRRFISRRGKSSNIYSDCGTNFVGATAELKEFLKFTEILKKDESVVQQVAAEGIQWHFNPPAAPHFGGLWEAGVKSVKYHLRRLVGEVKLSYEEMETVLLQIEACLNSRPLCPLSNDPNGLEALTPGHFLIGSPLTALPEPDLGHLPVSRLSRWQHVQFLVQHFWRRWSSEYISRLQQRPKWMGPQVNLEVGNLVLLKDEKLSPLKWKLGRIIQVHPGADDKVRVVTVKTAFGEFKRPVVKLCLLPLETTSSS